MRTKIQRHLRAGIAATLWTLAAMTSVAQAPVEPSPVMAKLIDDHELFGDDALAAIRAATAWRGVVRRYLVIESDHAVADQPIAGAEGEAAAALQTRTAQVAAARRPAAARDELTARVATLRAEVVRMPDDGTRRLSLRRGDAIFLKAGVKLATIEQRYGKPQRIFTELVESQGERRPAVLTIYEYDGGAVRFASSDFSVLPGTVDRVFLDLAAVERALAAREG